ncbi:hypothetical protein EZV62_012216 [Acer yangbiense]|uniref:Aminotransferase-like plant mobile domain-containing protein n=1 Tax=Acer yangbiense TaxID=1000413 RepID=A0A5C7HUT4_9ROSI|nr:hypothetical protein EZV62_012216 [Acer yangbiense]
MPKEDIVDDKGHPKEAEDEDNKVPPFDTRCTTKFTLDPSVISHIMGISDGGDIVDLHGDLNDVWRSKFRITNRGIKLPQLEEQLKSIKTTDDDFKITFYLYLLGTILAPTAGEYVDERYLNVLGDVQNIRDWQPTIVDKKSLPVVSWTSVNIKKCMKQLRQQGCYGTGKVLINDYVAPTASTENVHKAEHNSPNDDMLKLVLLEIQNFRKELQ